MYRALVTISMVLVAGTSGYVAVNGLTEIFGGNGPVIITLMGLGLELGKLVTTAHLHRNWKRLGMARWLYALVIVVLVGLTSIEVMGFLAQANSLKGRDMRTGQATAAGIDGQRLALADQIKAAECQIDYLDKELLGYPQTKQWAAKRRELNEQRTEQAGKVTELRAQVVALTQRSGATQLNLVQAETSAGPVAAISRTFGVPESQAASWLILLLTAILEPLSLGLTIAVSLAWTPVEEAPTAKKVRKTNKKPKAPAKRKPSRELVIVSGKA